MIESNLTREEIAEITFNVVKKYNDRITLKQIYEEEGIDMINY